MIQLIRVPLAIALFVLGLRWPLLAQAPDSGSIEGRVVDARTGAGLGRAAVAIADGPSTLTDDNGRFALAGVRPGTVRLQVSVVGYILVRRDFALAAGQTVALTIPVSEGTGTYTETVNVAADVFRSEEPGAPAQQVLGSAELQNLRGVLADDPLRAVQVLPGVATGDDLRSEFSVRGSDFSHTNFTVEGFATPFLLHTVRAIEDRANSGSVAMINSDILESVTLLNGGYPQRQGNRTGAEVGFRLREGSRDRRQVRLAVSGTNASAVAEGPIGQGRRGSWLLSARKSYLDLLVRRLTNEGLTFSFSDVQGKGRFRSLAAPGRGAGRDRRRVEAARRRPRRALGGVRRPQPISGRGRRLAALGQARAVVGAHPRRPQRLSQLGDGHARSRRR